MLGFDATGRPALGQITGSLTYGITADTRSYSVSGVAALFNISELASASSYTVTGNAAPLGNSISASPGAFLVTGIDAGQVTTARRPLYLRGASYWRGRP